MKLKYWQTDEFKKQEKEWYQKLEEEKFKDIEKIIGGRSVLRQRSTNCYRNSPQAVLEAKLRYYELLGEYTFRENGFRDSAERLIMQRRAAGVKIVDICKELEAMGERRYRGTVRFIIQKYEKKWQIKRR